MKLFKHLSFFAAVFILECVILAASVPAFGKPQYRITDLGDLPGGSDFSVAYGISDTGLIVGWSETETGTRAFLWHSGEMIDLGDLPGGRDTSMAWGVNNAGQVVGRSEDAETGRAFLWEAGTMTDLGGLPGGSGNAMARDINSVGQVVGRSVGAALVGPIFGQATLWESEGVIIKGLGDLTGGRDESSAHSINDGGQVVGESEAASGTHAFLWKPGGPMIDLGDLPGGIDESIAHDINNAGLIVGESQAAEGQRAFLWDSGVMMSLGDLGGTLNRSSAYAINDSGKVVGRSNAAEGDSAFIWDAKNGIQNLNDLIDPEDPILSESSLILLHSGHDINEAGQIVGGMTINGVRRAFLMTPVPRSSNVIPSDYMIAGNIGDTWTYANLDSTKFTWTLSEVVSGPNAGLLERGNNDSGMVYNLTNNILTIHELNKTPIDPTWGFVFSEMELGQIVTLNDDPVNPSMYLFWNIPNITVQAGTFHDVFALVWLDVNFSANPANTQLGLDPLITAAVTDIEYYVRGIGLVEFQGIDASTGLSDGDGYELVSTTVVPIPVNIAMPFIPLLLLDN